MANTTIVPRTRRTSEELEAALASQQLQSVPPVEEVRAEKGKLVEEARVEEGTLVEEMRARARARVDQQALAQAQQVTKEALKKRWLYNSNTENISEFPEMYLIIEDGYFEYTPSDSFPFTDEEKDVHLEFCRSRVNTKPIDGLANAKLIRDSAEKTFKQIQYLPPQPQSMPNEPLTIEAVV